VRAGDDPGSPPPSPWATWLARMANPVNVIIGLHNQPAGVLIDQ
jgi:hypothetical protein